MQLLCNRKPQPLRQMVLSPNVPQTSFVMSFWVFPDSSSCFTWKTEPAGAQGACTCSTIVPKMKSRRDPEGEFSFVFLPRLQIDREISAWPTAWTKSFLDEAAWISRFLVPVVWGLQIHPVCVHWYFLSLRKCVPCVPIGLKGATINHLCRKAPRGGCR